MENKGWKVFWIICAILAAVGIFLTVAGAALGGFGILRSREDEGIIRQWLNRFGIRTKVTTTVKIDDPGDWGTVADSGYVPGEVNGNTVIAFRGIDELDIRLTGLGVSVLPYDGDRIIVDTSYCREDLQNKINVRQDDSELKVEMDDWRRLSTQDCGIMYISVPQRTYFEKISMDAQAGLIEIEGVEAAEISASADAGQVVLTSFNAERLEADCGAGQIILDGEVTEKVEVDCDLGEIQCTLPGSLNDYDYEIDCDLGEVVIDVESYSSFLNNKMKGDNGGGCKIKADCNLGAIEFTFR